MSNDKTDLTVGFVLRNLITQTNFVEFRDSQNFHDFQGERCPVDPKNEIFEENLGSCTII